MTHHINLIAENKHRHRLWSCSRSCLDRCRVARPCGPALLPSYVDGPVFRTYPVKGDKGDPVSRTTDSVATSSSPLATTRPPAATPCVFDMAATSPPGSATMT